MMSKMMEHDANKRLRRSDHIDKEHGRDLVSDTSTRNLVVYAEFSEANNASRRGRSVK